MDADSKWISIGNMKPTTDCKVRAVLALVEGNYRIYHVWPGDSNFPGMTHWQPLPEPPPKPDLFEEWWSKHSSGSPAITMTAEDRHSLICRGAAKSIWDAAIASTQNK